MNHTFTTLLARLISNNVIIIGHVNNINLFVMLHKFKLLTINYAERINRD